jgi:hypothetical protein
MQSHVARSGSFALMLFAFTLAPLSSNPALAQEAEVLSNTSVVNMIAAKVGKDIILTKIRTTKTAFDVTVAGIVRLHQNKVPADVMKAMLLASGDTKLAVPSTGPAEVLTNSDIVTLVSGQVPRAIIIEKIRVTKAKYDVTSEGLVSLNSSKVPSDVQKAMMAVPPSK